MGALPEDTGALPHSRRHGGIVAVGDWVGGEMGCGEWVVCWNRSVAGVFVGLGVNDGLRWFRPDIARRGLLCVVVRSS